MTTPSIGELLARLEEQQARIERLESGAMAPVAGPAGSEPAESAPVRDEPAESGPRSAGMTRRGMVTAAAAGTAGIVGAMLVEAGGVASAATGPGTFTSSSSTPAVKATNTGKGFGIQATAQSAAAIRANQNGTTTAAIAVYGVINNTTGTGTGVEGTSPKGTGVSGSSTSGTGVAGGSAKVVIDPEFAQTVHAAGYHVFVQAEGECRGLFVRDKTATGFVVQELGSGTSNTPFAYRIVALRKDVSAPRLSRVTLPSAPAQGPAGPREPARPRKPAGTSKQEG